MRLRVSDTATVGNEAAADSNQALNDWQEYSSDLDRNESKAQC